MEEEYIQVLIRKYIEGTASANERDELLQWYRSKTDKELLWPYQTRREEEFAKARMMQNLQRQTGMHKTVKRIIPHLYFKVAAAAILVMGCFFIFYRLKVNQTTGTLAFVNTQPGEHKLIKLTDGSVVWLGAKSSMHYPLVFNGPTREITFEGEAFFEIAKDQKHPFIVHTGITSTRVLGTSFNIAALKNKPGIVVSLITGKVAFSDGKVQLKLLPGQQVVYNKLNSAAKLEDIPDMSDVINRHKGDYEYKNVSIAAIAEDVNLNFNTNIQVAESVKNCLFYGRMNPGESPENFLKKLAIVINATVVKTRNGYLIDGGGCR